MRNDQLWRVYRPFESYNRQVERFTETKTGQSKLNLRNQETGQVDLSGNQSYDFELAGKGLIRASNPDQQVQFTLRFIQTDWP